MSAVAASLIAVAGTLLGSFSTYWFQQKGSRQERLRQDRLAACSEFAAAASDLRRAIIAAWFRKKRADLDAADDQAAADYRKAHAEADRLGAVAQGAKFRMLLVIDDQGLRELADVVLRHVDTLYSAKDKTKVEALEMEFEEHMSVFLARAAQLLR